MKRENQLLTRLAKAVGITKMDAPVTAPVEAVVEAVEHVVEAVTEGVTQTLELTVDTSAVQTELDAMKAEFDGVKAGFESVIAELTGKLEAAEAALAAVAAEKAELVAKAAAVKLAARKEKVIAAIGTDRADALMAATEGLDDAQFSAVVSAMAVATDAETKSPLFNEVGVTAEADAAAVVEESVEARILKQKYGVK